MATFPGHCLQWPCWAQNLIHSFHTRKQRLKSLPSNQLFTLQHEIYVDFSCSAKTSIALPQAGFDDNAGLSEPCILPKCST